MTPKQAKRRYMKVFIPSMVSYLAATFLASWVIRETDLPVVANVLLALLPALCILWLIWGHGRWILEVDEYERHLEFKSLMGGIGLTLAFTSVWGFMEMLVEAPAFPVFYIFVIFCFAYSLCKCGLKIWGRIGINLNDGDVV